MTATAAALPASAADVDPLITSATAAALAGNVSQMTLWRWAKDGVIPQPIKIRRRKYWRRAEFVAAINNPPAAA